jgi:predicted aminopeptidase
MRTFLFLSVFLLLPACSGLSYLAENGVSQWRLFNRARPVSDVLSSPRTSEETRRAIAVVKEAKAFAVSLGLKATGSYESYVQLDGPCVIWAVSAADPVGLEEKTWKFPIVGEVPYLGFFRKESAEGEVLRLRESASPSPDTWVRCVPAFSSLGWFSDPLYSSMLGGNLRDIVELVIHESLHATVWVGDSVDFNEKLANFVGLEGSLRYMEKVEGRAGLERARLEVAGEKLFGEFIDSMLAAYRSRVGKEETKEAFYDRLPHRYEEFIEASQKKGAAFTPLKASFKGWNNAALLTYANYYSDFSVMEEMLAKCGGSLSRFVRWIAAEKEKGTGRFLSAPEEHLVEIVKGSSCVP